MDAKYPNNRDRMVKRCWNAMMHESNEVILAWNEAIILLHKSNEVNMHQVVVWVQTIRQTETFFDKFFCENERRKGCAIEWR